MFSSVGWGEVLVLLVAGLVILGPERLPGAVSWTMKSLKQVRDYASGATSQLKNDLGPEFEDLRKPLADLNELRGMSPRSLITKHLLDGDDSFFTGEFADTPIKPVSAPMPVIDPITPASTNAADPAFDVDGPSVSMQKSAPTPSDRQERPSVTDWDAT
ncbi:Sec-independent protein translocase protein TatB [Williamsia sp. CHRR-6]|uniref:Sec-independent protein translocase protein TatB n=1 Tax=Williamsia sp. CHRR-6 TaxID=2835871 RepID=UPI001BDA8AFF|nr:Sec-independent protein translocase protein TatB [Williamsia sp. CHRR-6]MBT0568467.1 Sec-independent protein translocase protein TatB [Williamsia sp. CHRR-6]